MINQIHMQPNQIHQQEVKYKQHQPNNPHWNQHIQIFIHTIKLKQYPTRHQPHLNQIHTHMHKQDNHTPKELPIIPPPNTIIQPYAMMIKPTHTTITYIAMFAILVTITITKNTIF